MIRKYISFTMSVQILRNLTEGLNYLGKLSISEHLFFLILQNIINTETTVSSMLALPLCDSATWLR